MFGKKHREEFSEEKIPENKKKHIRIRPILLGMALTGYTVFTLLDAFVIPRDIVTLESVQAAAANSVSAENEDTEREDAGETSGIGNAGAEDDSGLTENNASGSENSDKENAGAEDRAAHKHRPGGRGNGSGRPGSGKGKRGKKSGSTSVGNSADSQKADNSESGKKAGGNTDGTSGSVSEEASAAVVTSDSYQADGISITLTEERIYDTEVYIADIQLDDPSQLMSGLADNSFGRNLSQKTSEMASSLGAVLAINGDYYGFRDTGYVMRNGYLYRSTVRSGSDNEDLVVYSDGSMEIINESEVTAEELVEKGAVQIYSFGPGLISDGTVTVTAGDEVDQSMSSNPRTAIGMIEPGHYIMVVSDGRTDESAGLSLAQLAEVMQNAGCTEAYNLDGGGSTTMWFNGEIINNPTGGRGSNERAVSDIVYIGK